jgi:hypothetical protein
MKSFEEILQDQRVLKVYKNVQLAQVQKLKIEVRSIKQSDKALLQLTQIDGWEHLSVSFKNKIPSWDCMQEMKELCFKDDEECFQLHPKADDYVNNNEYTLHIWRPVEGMKQIPPSILVGFRPNHIEEDIEAAKKLHEKIGCPLSDEEIELMRLSSTPDGLKKAMEQLANNPIELMNMAAKLGILGNIENK